MKASLRFQFLFPMLLAVLTIAFAVTLCSKWFSDRAARIATEERLSTTGRLCINAPFPLTTGVLDQIQQLSAVKLAVLADTPSGSLQFESKSNGLPQQTSPEVLKELLQNASSAQVRARIASLNLGSSGEWNAIAFRLLGGPDGDQPNRYLVLMEPSDVSSRMTLQAFALPLLTGVFSSMGIAIVATYVASRIGNRIDLLEQHVQKIAGGSFASIEPIGPVDAIHSLYRSVNSMSNQLQQSAQEMAQNERSRLITLIASGLAHELRNHLTGAKLAIQTCTPSERDSEAVSVALKQMKMAEETIQRLLAVRLESTNSIGDSMPIAEVQHSVRELVQPIAQHQNVTIQWNNAITSHLVSDGPAIVGSLINLLLNAIEASGPGGKVCLDCRIVNSGIPGGIGNPEAVEWTVRDNGPGPSEQIMGTMFEPFATTKREGVGLGLAMCKRIALRHGGVVHWQRRDGWTEFLFRVQTQSE